MELTPDVRLNDSRDWLLASNKYLGIISFGDVGLAVKATLEIKQLPADAPEAALRFAIRILVNVLGDSPPRLQVAVAQALCSIVLRDGAKLAPVMAGAGLIPVVLRVLPGSEEVPQRALLRCLSCLLSFDTASRATFVRIGGAEVVLDMFPGCSGGVKRYLVDVLSALALSRDVRRLIVNQGRVEYLVEAVSLGTMASRTRGAQAVGLLGITRMGRHALVELGAVQALVGLLKDGDAPARLVAGNAIGIIASAVHHLPLVGHAGAIPLYAELLKESNPLGREIAEDVFCLLALLKENAPLILENLVRILMDEDEHAQSAAMDVLWDLAGYKNISTLLHSSGAIAVLVGLLQNGNDDIKEKAAGAVAHLSYEENNRKVLMEVGAIPVLIGLLVGDLGDLTEFAAEALINFSEDPSYRQYVSEIYDIPTFLALHDRLIRIRNSQEHLIESMRERMERHVTQREFS